MRFKTCCSSQFTLYQILNINIKKLKIEYFSRKDLIGPLTNLRTAPMCVSVVGLAVGVEQTHP
jgi:hypothetical protein